MRSDNESNKKSVILFAAGIMLFSITTCLAFAGFRLRLNYVFDSLVEENLMAYTESQHREMQAVIEDITGTLEAIAAIFETSETSVDSGWLMDYLEAISENKERYDVEYRSMEDLRASMKEAGENESYRETYDRLMNRENVISDVRFSRRRGGRYYFSVAVPVIQHDEVVGVLRSVLDGELLVQSVITNSLHDHAVSCLVKENGDLIPVGEQLNPEDGEPAPRNLVEETRGIGGNDALSLAIARMAGHDSETEKLGLIDGHIVFISVTDLGYNGWHIVNLLNADNVSEYSGRILQDMVAISLLLILLIAVLGVILFTVLMRQERRLRLQESGYAILAKFSDTVLCSYDYRTDTLSFTPNAAELLPLKELTIHPASSGTQADLLIHPDDRPAVKRIFENPDIETEEPMEQEVRLLGLDGEYIWCSLRYQVVRDDRGMPVQLLARLMDVSERKIKEQELLEKSTVDATTGLLNKYAAETGIEARIVAGAQGFLFMIDIDNFKLVNDRLGHMAGDRLLAQVGTVIRGVFRRTDLAGRVGGDEFVVFMADTASIPAAGEKAGRLLEHLRDINIGGETLKITASIGIAAIPAHGSSYQEVYRLADQAMYQAKHSGKNRFFIAGSDDPVDNSPFHRV